MASAPLALSLEDKSRRLYALCEAFKHIDREVIESVAEYSKFDMLETSNILYEMTSARMGNSQAVNKVQYEEKNALAENCTKSKTKYDNIVDFIKQGYKIMILMRGLPGSGKSTLAMTLLYNSLEHVNRDEFMFSTDDFFYKSGKYKYNVTELEEAHKWNQHRCFSNMKRCVSPIIIDNTNLQVWEMQNYCVMAVQFGYIIEIAEPQTPWALDPKVLAQKNDHGVEKRKIQEMCERFEQGITLKDLFRTFDLKYNDKMPQYRKYPPIIKPKKPVDQTDTIAGRSGAWKSPQREYSSPNKNELPNEYVHKFEMKHDPLTSIKDQITDVDQLLNVSEKTKYEDQNMNADLISFINELKEPPQNHESIKPAQVDIISKHLEENKALMFQMMDFLKEKMSTKDSQATTCVEKIPLSDAETQMEVSIDHGINTEVQIGNTQEADNSEQINKKPETNIYSSARGLEELEEENIELRDQLERSRLNLKSEKKEQELNKPSILFKATSAVEESPLSEDLKTMLFKEKLQIDRLNMFLKKFTPESPNDFEFIENTPSTSAEQVVKTPAKNEKPSVPKFDSKAWGLPDDALVTWEMSPPPPLLPPPPQEFQVPDVDPILIETRDQSTNTRADDFKVARQSYKDDELVTRLTGRGLPINVPKKMNNMSPRKKVTLDKSSMTDEEELLLKMDCEVDQQVKKLMELFPNIPLEYLLDVYEKCGKNFHWAADLISSSPTHWLSYNQKNVNKSKEFGQVPMNTSFSFDLKDWNLIPPKEENSQEIDEEITRKKQKEEELHLKKQEEVLQLKKQLEKTVTIGKEHYSDHVWQIKNAKMGTTPNIVVNPEPVRKPDSPELMTVDDDTIYISDDNSEMSSDDDEISEDMVEVDLGSNLVQQLECMFGKLVPGDNFKPVVQMPESLARQLHALYLESICRQIENQSDYISSQLKEDEEFAMNLQEKEREFASGNNLNEIMDEELAMSLYRKDIEQWKNLTPDTLALKLTRQKLHAAFPHIKDKILDEILVAHNNNYMQTVEAIMSSTDHHQMAHVNRENLLEPPISDITLNEMKKQEQYVNKVTDEADGQIRSAMSYRDEANRHMEKRRELLHLVNVYHQRRVYAVSMYYRNLAEKELKKAELANQQATQLFIRENAKKAENSDVLDLHFLYVKGAVTSLDIFIDYHISNLRSVNKPQDYYFVITGRGNRSENGKSKLKPAVMRRLRKRKVQFTQVNPGMLKIKVQKNLPMSTDLEKASN